MKIAIIGEPQVGKTTLLKVLTEDKYNRGQGYFSGFGTFFLEDPNLDFLAKLYESEKVTPVHVEVLDFEGFGKLWKDEKRGEIKNELSKIEAFVIVLGDLGESKLEDTFWNIEYKLLLTDLDFVSKRLEFLKKERLKRKVNDLEVNLLERLESWLSSEKPLTSFDFSDAEKEIIRGYTFLSVLPQIFVINVKEDDLEKEIPKVVMEKIEERNAPYLRTCLKIEEELMGLEPEERNEILKSYGLKSVKGFLSSVLKPALGITIFYTAGKTEARAWYVDRGATAKRAAGRIHSDMERGFIRAEVINVEDLKIAGSEKRAKEMGLYRLEGKDYIIKDGDVIVVRFSV